MAKDTKINEIIKQVFSALDETVLDDQDDAVLPAYADLFKCTENESIIGQVIGPWKIVALLGKGGMSAVYLVERDDQSIVQLAALKILPVELVSQQVVERFVRERQILVDLDHPQIAKLLDLGVTESQIPWFVMAYFEGQDIIGFLHSVKSDLTQKTVLFKQVCEAIAYAHKQGVVHRDIKPGNILVNEQFEVKVLDFGIALKDENNALTMTGAIMGTPGYMSPEQSKGRNDLVDARSDVFALGTLFYHMLVGHKPFEANSAAEIFYKIIHEEPKPLDQTIPTDLKAIIAQCLAKEPDQRYATAGALSRDIEAYLNGDVIVAKPVSWLGYWMKKGKKYPKTTGLIAVMFMVTILAVALSMYQSHLNDLRLQAAEVFVKQAEDINNKVRRIHMLPLHNVQPEYHAIRKQINGLQQQIANSGADQSGLTDLALGSTYLSMRDYDNALTYLLLSQSKGWQSTSLNEQLGYVLAVEWSEQLKTAKSIKDETEQAQHLAAAKEKYYQPAVNLLSQVEEKSPYLAGRLAWIEERYDDAIEHYLTEIKTNPWHHEAAKQISEVYMHKFRTTGSSAGYDQAMPFMDKSNEYLAMAIEIGRSDPLNYVSRCTNAGIDIQIKRYLERFDEIAVAFATGMAACEAALELEPEAFSPWANMNLLLQNQAQMLESKAMPANEVYQQALAIAQRGIQQHPTKIPLLVAQIKPLTKLAAYAISAKNDPNEYFQSAIAVAKQAITIDPTSSEGWKELGRVYWAMADYLQFESRDKQQAIEMLQLAQAAYTDEQQTLVSVTSHINAALIEVQLAKLHAETNQINAAIGVLTASIERRIRYLPDSKNYFKYHSQALDDLLLLADWVSGSAEIESVLTALVNKSCAVVGTKNEAIIEFNNRLQQLNQLWPPLNGSLCQEQPTKL